VRTALEIDAQKNCDWDSMTGNGVSVLREVSKIALLPDVCVILRLKMLTYREYMRFSALKCLALEQNF